MRVSEEAEDPLAGDPIQTGLGRLRHGAVDVFQIDLDRASRGRYRETWANKELLFAFCYTQYGST